MEKLLSLLQIPAPLIYSNLAGYPMRRITDISLASWRLMPNLKDDNNALNELQNAIAQEIGNSQINPRRTIAKRFYLTEAEDQQLELLCQGVSLSAFVRAKVFSASVPRPRPIVPQINRETYVLLAGLRNSCNQMAKAINTAAQRNEGLPLTQDYLDQLGRLEGLLGAISLQFTQGHRANQKDDEA